MHLLAFSIRISDSGDDELVDRNRGLPFLIVLEGVTPIVEVVERTPAAASRPFGHLGFLEGRVLVSMYRLQEWRESNHLYTPSAVPYGPHGHPVHATVN